MLTFSLFAETAILRVSPGGPQLCNEFSKDHSGYDPNETDIKIMRALNEHKPHTCDEIRKNGFPCVENCKIKAPIGLLWKGNRSGKKTNDNALQEIETTVYRFIQKAEENPSEAISEALKDKFILIDNLVKLSAYDPTSVKNFYMNLERSGARVKDIKRLEKAVKHAIKKSKFRLVKPEDTHNYINLNK